MTCSTSCAMNPLCTPVEKPLSGNSSRRQLYFTPRSCFTVSRAACNVAMSVLYRLSEVTVAAFVDDKSVESILPPT